MSTFRSEQIQQPISLTGTFTGNLIGTASYATFAENGGGGTVDTGSLLTTASFNSYTGSSTSQFAGTASFVTTASYAENGSETLQEIINNSIVSSEIIGIVGSNDFFTIKETDGQHGLYIYGSNTSPNKSVWIGADGNSTTTPSSAIGVHLGDYTGISVRGLQSVPSSSFILTYDGNSTQGGISYISASRITFPYTGNAVITGSLLVSGSSGGFGGITGSLQGTASYALTASYAMNGGGSSSPSNLISTGSITASVDVRDGIFKIISGSSTYMYVNNIGNIGLRNVPTYSLDINLGNRGSIRLQTNSGNTNSFLEASLGTSISNNVYWNGTDWIYEKTSPASILQLSSSGDITISNYPSQTAGNTLPSPTGNITISNSGLVGINTSSPSVNLDINGNLNVSNLIYLNGNTGNAGEVLISQGGSPPIWASTGSFTDSFRKLILTGVTDTAGTLSYNTVANTLEDTFTFTPVQPGVYHLVMDTSSPFASGYTYVVFSVGLPGPGGGNVYNTNYEWASTSRINFYVKKDDNGYEGVLTNATIEIRVYPIP